MRSGPLGRIDRAGGAVAVQHRDEYHAGGDRDQGGNKPLLQVVQDLVEHDCPSGGDAKAVGGMLLRRRPRIGLVLQPLKPAAACNSSRICLPTRLSAVLWVGNSLSIQALRWASVR